MQWQHVGHRIKGFYAIAKYATRHLEKASEKAEHKLKVLKFCEEYGPLISSSLNILFGITLSGLIGPCN